MTSPFTVQVIDVGRRRAGARAMIISSETLFPDANVSVVGQTPRGAIWINAVTSKSNAITVNVFGHIS